jgi:hypothetical protein
VILETKLLGGSEDGFQNIGNQYLFALGLGHDAGGGVDAGPEKVLAGADRFPGVEPNADLHRMSRMSAVVVVERALNTDSTLDGLARRVECHHKAVAGRLDLKTGMLSNLPPHNFIVLIHDLMSASLALVLAKARRAHHVSEQHSHGRRLGHVGCLPQTFRRTTLPLVVLQSGRTKADRSRV